MPRPVTKTPIPKAIRDWPRAEEGMDWLYAYYARDGELLYIGVAIDPLGRAASGHRSGSIQISFLR